MVRIALANIRFPQTPEESITLTERAIAEAGGWGRGCLLSRVFRAWVSSGGEECAAA